MALAKIQTISSDKFMAYCLSLKPRQVCSENIANESYGSRLSFALGRQLRSRPCTSSPTAVFCCRKEL